MKQPKRYRRTIRRVLLRLAAVTLALSGLSASVLVINMASATSTYTSKQVVVSTTKNATLGTILVSGKTLYTLKPSKTACTTQCLKIWPALLLPKGVTKATAGSGVSAAKLGTVKRAGGALQVTYGGKALYRFFDDTAAGQVRGNNVTDTWGTWLVVVTTRPTKSSTTAASGPSPAPTTSPTSGTSSTPTTTAPTTTTTPTTTTRPPTTTTTSPGSGGVAF